MSEADGWMGWRESDLPSGAIHYIAPLTNPLPYEVANWVLRSAQDISEDRNLERVVFHLHRTGKPSVKVAIDRLPGDEESPA